MKNVSIGIFTIVAGVSLLHGQSTTPQSTQESPQPGQPVRTAILLGTPWPLNGDVSKSTESVFVNPSGHEYVVALRSSDGQVERLIRVPLHNEAIAHITTTVTRDQSGMFHYVYAVANDIAAPRPIQRWALGIEEMIGTLDVKHLTWAAGPAPPMSGIVRVGHRAVGWSAKGEQIAPGQSVSGFEIVSDLGPGYVPAAFYSTPRSPDLTAEDWASLPADVAAKLRSRMSTGTDATVIPVIGPRFAAGTPASMVLDNFMTAIGNLHAAGLLSAKAEAAAELQRRLYAIESGESREAELRLDTVAKPGRSLEPGESEALRMLGMTLEWLNGK